MSIITLERYGNITTNENNGETKIKIKPSILTK